MLLQFCQSIIVPCGGSMVFQPAFGESLWQNSLKRRSRGCHIANFRCANRLSDLTIGSQIDVDGLALLPIGRDLQYRRSAQAAMRDQHFFAEGVMIGLGDEKMLI